MIGCADQISADFSGQSLQTPYFSHEKCEFYTIVLEIWAIIWPKKKTFHMKFSPILVLSCLSVSHYQAKNASPSFPCAHLCLMAFHNRFSSESVSVAPCLQIRIKNSSLIHD